MKTVELILLILLVICFVYSKNDKDAKSNKKGSKVEPQKYANSSINIEIPSLKNLIPTDNIKLNYCSFFNNRAPSPQISLKNCTWYKENSCCLQQEIESTFSKVIFFVYLNFILFFNLKLKRLSH